jgi:hypothetical protein
MESWWIAGEKGLATQARHPPEAFTAEPRLMDRSPTAAGFDQSMIAPIRT